MKNLSEARQELQDLPMPRLVSEEPPDFSLVMGGPIFQLFLRSHLAGDGMDLVVRRILVITLIAWPPLLLLSALGRHLAGASVQLPFLRDVEAHVRLLVALPALIAAELLVHSRIRPIVKAFLTRRIIRRQDLPKFVAAIDSAMNLRNSVLVELGLLALVFSLGQWSWRSQAALLSTTTWYALPQGGQLHLTAAGYWYVFVSVPIFQFILLRWYLRFFIWFRFLWQVSRLDLHLIPTHPDRAGGLAFLGKSAYAFSPILFAQGALIAGLIGSRVLHEGAKLLSFKMEAIGCIAFFLVFVLAPLTMFTPQLASAKRKGLGEYGLFASFYAEAFEQKWVVRDSSADDELLGTGDIQSLADLGNSYALVRDMRPVPFDMQDIVRLAAVTAVPLLPLGLTIFSLDQMVTQILKVLF
ncbi:MAG TPA: hypothetical protein VFP11_02195 [Candidatus Angelobacter sp.]|nr:hypothetical protein [Candidatus Angelobacter sp.]